MYVCTYLLAWLLFKTVKGGTVFVALGCVQTSFRAERDKKI